MINKSIWFLVIFFFQAEDGIRDLVRSRGLGDVYKRQRLNTTNASITIPSKIRSIMTVAKEADIEMPVFRCSK